MVTDGTRTVVDSTRTINGGTQTVNGGTLTVGGGTETSDDQHQLGSAIVGTTQSRHHQAKQHPHVC
jgi:hypothetical protein